MNNKHFFIKNTRLFMILIISVGLLPVHENTGKQHPDAVIAEAAAAKYSGSITISRIKDHYMALKINQTRSLVVTADNPEPDRKLHWSSSNESVATVTGSGTIKALKKGTAKITVSSGNTAIQPYTFTVEAVPANTQIYRDGFYYHPITPDIKKRITGKSYTKNKYISLSELSYVRIKHHGYGGTVKTGELIVNQSIARDIVEIFNELYKIKYPIQKMRLIDEYTADDMVSMEDNNTSSFNFRAVSGSTKLSNHASGMAIDINPRINPYVKGGIILPANGTIYAIRDTSLCKGRYKDNMIHKNDAIYRLFIEHGFEWGGDWKYSKDYQHFEKPSGN